MRSGLDRLRCDPSARNEVLLGQSCLQSHSKAERTWDQRGSRIWLCLTSVLSTLPFHAAGSYKDDDGNTKYLLDDYISSYTPTLKSLINARSGAHNGNQKLLVVGDSDTELASTKRECNRFRRISRCLFDDKASRESVMSALRNLTGAGLTLLDIIRAHLPDAEFSFLSACHTAEQSPDAALDEVLHLSAAMQFCAFRSVIGTIFKRAAAAVREAAVRLKERWAEGPDGTKRRIKVKRWVNLVHIAA
ncbi:GSE1_5 [Sanghuangporus sanghuang]